MDFIIIYILESACQILPKFCFDFGYKYGGNLTSSLWYNASSINDGMSLHFLSLHLCTLIKFSFYSIKFLYFCTLISKYINILWFLNSYYKWLAIFYYFLIIKILWGFPGCSDGEESVYNAGNLGLIPGSGRSPGEGNGSPLQYSCLENPMDRGAWLTSLCLHFLIVKMGR